jgi:hypothetical protein
MVIVSILFHRISLLYTRSVQQSASLDYRKTRLATILLGVVAAPRPTALAQRNKQQKEGMTTIIMPDEETPGTRDYLGIARAWVGKV